VRLTRPLLLLALAALLAPRVEASRTSVWESNPPAAVPTTTSAAGLLAPLAPAGPLESIAADVEPVEPVRFDLGDIVLVESPREERFSIGLADLVESPALRGPPLLDEDPHQAFKLRDPETRIRGFELLPPFRVGASPTLSLWSRPACGSISCGLASDSRYDPWGLCGWWNDRPCMDDLKFAADVAAGYAEGMLLHPVQNAQRAAGGAAGVVNLAAKMASEPYKASFDFWAGAAGNEEAAERTEARVEGVINTVTSPIGTLVGGHKAALTQIEAHEAAGERFSSGMVGGELGANDALLAYGGAQAATGAARALSSGRMGFLLEEAGLTTPKTRWTPGRSIVMKTKKGQAPAFSTVQKRFWKNQGMKKAPQRVNPVTGTTESMELSHRFAPQRFTLLPPNIRNAGFNLEPLWPQEHAAVDWYRWQTLDPRLKPLVPTPRKPPL